MGDDFLYLGFMPKLTRLLTLSIISLLCFQCNRQAVIPIPEDATVVFVGGNTCSRMLNYGFLETEIQMRFPTTRMRIRNMCDGGDTPGFRPHSGRNTPWAFPGAEAFQTSLAEPSGSEGHLEYPDEWLTRLETDVIMGFFGYSESFNGPDGLDNFKEELRAWVRHTQNQKYNGTAAPRIILVSPLAFEDLSDAYDLPDGTSENANLQIYADAIQEVANSEDVAYLDIFTPSKAWFEGEEALTIDGVQLNELGNERLAGYISSQLFGEIPDGMEERREQVTLAVQDKNWYWHNDFKIPNGVHVFGRRYEPYGPDNYPAELIKVRELTAIRDQAIWAVKQGVSINIDSLDALTTPLPDVETNYAPEGGPGSLTYLYGEDALAALKVPNGYRIELFASEEEFPDLANPVQLSFDNRGRLWVATMPTYPHYRPGDTKPNDKLLILEDTNGDGKADKQTVFADGLHLPVGFELAPEGVYVSQGTNFKLLTDTDGDDKADKVEILLSGFDDHDTHHNISAFSADPSGALYMAEGVFLHTNVETPYGTVRATNGGFYRYSPQKKKLERTAQLAIPNPWGIAFDDWGQVFFAETSGPDVLWMMPGTVKPRYGIATPKSRNLIEDAHRVRPTSGLEFVSSRHFPEEVQGDLLINNNIGFLGTKQHEFYESGTGYASRHRQDLVVSSDRNFRPVDMEFAPDGSLYLVDWHNVLVGHMQHNARDPLRDHVHGRIYRITYPSRPLVEPAKIEGATIEELLENLKVPEYRTRYRTRRELRGRDAGEVLQALNGWLDTLDPADPNFGRNRLEALWVMWGANQLNDSFIKEMLKDQDPKVRAAAVRVLRYTSEDVADAMSLLQTAARDANSRVRLEAIVAASWMSEDDGLKILEIAGSQPLDDWMQPSYEAALTVFGQSSAPEFEDVDNDLSADLAMGKEIYEREGFCITCHQGDGKGLPASGFPPLAGTSWAMGDEELIIKIILKGLMGPIEVLGEEYPGQVPMTAYENMLSDEEVAAVASYVRNSFGNYATKIDPATVTRVREEVSDKKGFYSPAELRQAHPK